MPPQLPYNFQHKQTIRATLQFIQQHISSHSHLSKSLHSSASCYLPAKTEKHGINRSGSLFDTSLKTHHDWMYRLGEDRYLMGLLDADDAVIGSQWDVRQSFLQIYNDNKSWLEMMREFDDSCKQNCPAAYVHPLSFNITEISEGKLTVCNVGGNQAVLGLVPKQEIITEESLQEIFLPKAQTIQPIAMNHPHLVHRNMDEVNRLKREFPEDKYIISNKKLKNMYENTRSIGAYNLKGYKPSEDAPKKLKELYETKKRHHSIEDGVHYMRYEPEVSHIDQHPNMRFMIVANDVFWNLISHEEAVRYVYNQLYNTLPELAADAEVKFRMSRPSILTHLVGKALVNQQVKNGLHPADAFDEIFSQEDRTDAIGGDIEVNIMFFNSDYGSSAAAGGGESAFVEYDGRDPEFIDYIDAAGRTQQKQESV